MTYIGADDQYFLALLLAAVHILWNTTDKRKFLLSACKVIALTVVTAVCSSNSRPAANTGYFQWRRVASKLGIE